MYFDTDMIPTRPPLQVVFQLGASLKQLLALQQYIPPAPPAAGPGTMLSPPTIYFDSVTDYVSPSLRRHAGMGPDPLIAVPTPRRIRARPPPTFPPRERQKKTPFHNASPERPGDEFMTAAERQIWDRQKLRRVEKLETRPVPGMSSPPRKQAIEPIKSLAARAVRMRLWKSLAVFPKPAPSIGGLLASAGGPVGASMSGRKTLPEPLPTTRPSHKVSSPEGFSQRAVTKPVDETSTAAEIPISIGKRKRGATPDIKATKIHLAPSLLPAAGTSEPIIRDFAYPLIHRLHRPVPSAGAPITEDETSPKVRVGTGLAVVGVPAVGEERKRKRGEEEVEEEPEGPKRTRVREAEDLPGLAAWKGILVAAAKKRRAPVRFPGFERPEELTWEQFEAAGGLEMEVGGDIGMGEASVDVVWGSTQPGVEGV